MGRGGWEEVDGRWTGGGWDEMGGRRWIEGRWEVDAASAASVWCIMSKQSGHRCINGGGWEVDTPSGASVYVYMKSKQP